MPWPPHYPHRGCVDGGAGGVDAEIPPGMKAAALGPHPSTRRSLLQRGQLVHEDSMREGKPNKSYSQSITGVVCR